MHHKADQVHENNIKDAEKTQFYFVVKSRLFLYTIAMEIKENYEKTETYQNYNPNPLKKQIGDCTVRAISKALHQDWESTYSGLALEGFRLCDMPSANHVWGAYLKRKGFNRYIIPETCPDCYTVKDFCRDHPNGIFILAIHGHVVAVEDGIYYDSWDSGDEIPVYYWQRKED